MEIREFQSHEQFEQFVRELRAKRYAANPQPGQGGQIMQSPFLFRGQANAEWHLATTLEQSMPSRQLLFHYLELAWEAHKPFEAFTARLGVGDVLLLMEH